MKDTSPEVIAAIKEYQVPGASNEFDENNFAQDGIGVEWSDHFPGTMVIPGGCIFLGMPVGFNKASIHAEGEDMFTSPLIKIKMFKSWAQFQHLWGYNTFNIPVWKHRNEKGHTFVRGMMPRKNGFFLHVILEDCLDKINCLEITEEDQKSMD